MASEAVLRDRYEDARDFTVADGTGIEKGTLLALTDPRTAIAVSASGCVCAGIAAREKIANDGRTRLSVYRRGIFDMVASGAITIGAPVMANGDYPNTILQATNTTTVSGAAIIGHALEAASANETIQVELCL